jgi:hypothetical protein
LFVVILVRDNDLRSPAQKDKQFYDINNDGH